MGIQLPPPKRGHCPQFSVHVCCGQTAGWIKMPLGTEVDLRPGKIVLDWDPAPPKRGHSIAHFSAHVCRGQMAAWIMMPLGMEVDLSSGHIVLDGPQLPPGKVHSSLPLFWSVSIVAKR